MLHYAVLFSRAIFFGTCAWLALCIVSYHYEKVLLIPRAIGFIIDSQRECARDGDFLCLALWVALTLIPLAVTSCLFSPGEKKPPPPTSSSSPSGYPKVPDDQKRGRLAVSGGEEGEATPHTLPLVD